MGDTGRVLSGSGRAGKRGHTWAGNGGFYCGVRAGCCEYSRSHITQTHSFGARIREELSGSRHHGRSGPHVPSAPWTAAEGTRPGSKEGAQRLRLR